MQKKKILMISDHIMYHSGVATQGRYLVTGLLKTKKYQFKCLGAAIKHGDYTVRNFSDPNGEWDSEDLMIAPIDGFGNKELIRKLLITEKPDALFLFTDPRFFSHIFDMEDEIHQICPIVWWHIWDSKPTPFHNKNFYQCIDLLNCISDLTYEMVKEIVPDQKVNHIPHGVPEELFHPLPEHEIYNNKLKLLGEDRLDHFICFWVNRNAHRKRPGDLLESWALFLDKLEKKYGHRKATLLMHTNPLDQEGLNLFEILNLFNLEKNVVFSNEMLDFTQMNILHNISDVYVNFSHSEGYGIGSLEAMMAGKPIIVQKTGGMTYQVSNPDGTYNGIGLDPDVKTLTGNVYDCPYIYQHYTSHEKNANAFFEVYEWGPEKRKEIGLRAMNIARERFNLNNIINKWDESLMECINNWKDRRKNWELIKI